MKDTHYFISWISFDNNNIKIGYGFKLLPFKEIALIEELEKDIICFCLKSAIKSNKNVVNVHIVAFNKV